MTDAPPGIDLNARHQTRFPDDQPDEVPEAKEEIRDLLQENGLDLDEQVEIFVVCREHGRIVGCAGLDRDVVKDVAVDPSLRGTAVSLRLGSRVLALAAARGHADLFLYCRPEHVDWFRGWAFHPLVEVPGVMTLLENNPLNLPSTSRGCRASGGRESGSAAIVMNANPFTLGHRFLAERAAENCDWLHLFVVREDAAQFAYADRFRLITEELAGIANLTIHHGSKYIISRATFPGYFLKDRSMIEHSFSAIDLLMFREHIAPALGINCRYVGNEPFDATTNSYNASMKHWLSDVLRPRRRSRRSSSNASPSTACRFRPPTSAHCWPSATFAEIARLVPTTTLEYLEKSFGPAREPAGR